MTTTGPARAREGREAEPGAAMELRRRTRLWHEQVDAAFSRFDLSQPLGYGGFLLAQARATGAAESALPADASRAWWRPRMHLLAADLHALGLPVPEPLPFAAREEAAWRWGVLYVLEGSRLGGAVLVRRLAAGMPRAFLGARHLPGEWHLLLRSIERRGAEAGPAWLDAAVAGATACFELYAGAARSDAGAAGADACVIAGR